MRIRSLHPSWWTDELITTWDWPTRLVHLGIMSYVDDNGVGRNNAKLIAAAVFPLEDDPRDTLARLSRALQTLSDDGAIVCYEADGVQLFYIVNFHKWQRIDRPGKARYPAPDEPLTCENVKTGGKTTVTADPSFATPSRHSRETLAPGVGEKGSRGEGEQGEKTWSSGRSFDDFWAAYPRHVAKDAARKAWDAATQRATPSAIIAGALRFRDDPNRDDAYTPHPATWLNAGRWDDEPLPPRPGSGRQTERDRQTAAWRDLPNRLGTPQQ